MGGPTLVMECEKWKLKHNKCFKGLGAFPQEKFHTLEVLRVYF